METGEQSVRRRNAAEKHETDGGDTTTAGVEAPDKSGAAAAKEGPFGKTPDGTVFQIPQTHDMLSSLFDPRLPKSNVDILTLSLLALQVALFALLPLSVSRYFFLAYFALWRLAYNAGLGYVLRRQSETKWIVRTVVQKGWMDGNKRPKVRAWIERELSKKMGEDYDFNAVPIEFNIWIMFRHFVDVILLNDFLSYCFFAVSFLQFPPHHSTTFHVLRWVGGWVLILFNLWVKVDAHRIVKDFAWYWGDNFFLSLDNLVFDGVFEFAPHPMYSVGYAGYYGLSLIVASETVLFASLAAHACQFGFLVYFENPHIERTYGSRKPLAARTPLHVPAPRQTVPILGDAGSATPSLAGTAAEHSETEPDHELDTDLEEDRASLDSRKSPSTPSLRERSNTMDSQARPLSPVVTRHDLDNRYFKKDLLLLKNFDIFRNRDFAFALVVVFGCFSFVLPSLGPTTSITLAFIHALSWRLFHTCGLGLALKAQSDKKWIVRHFLKHYHYETEGGAVEEAFENWKATYNLSLCMTYASFGALAWRCYTIPADWTVGSQLVRHTLGLLLIGLHVWTAGSTYEELGPFGWFYGDFFIQDYPAELYYTGIFRFLNNPERSMGGAAFFGLVLICGSKLLLVQAVIAVLAHWWFLSAVENPHMKKLYGDALRKDAGVTKTLRNVVVRNAHVLGGVTRSVREVQGTFEKVFEETADAVEEFLNRSGPRLSGYVEDTKILLKQSGERFIISRVTSDLAAYDQASYSLTLRPSVFITSHPHASTSTSPARFHLGEPIKIDWRAPKNHSRKDWIGIYRLGANKSKLVTRVSSQGHWVGVKAEEWAGDEYDEKKRGEERDVSERDGEGEVGVAVLEGKKLPWTVGTYELRYHHDGKHNVMTVGPPIEIFVEHPTNADDPQEVYKTLTSIVAQTLAFDHHVIPISAHHLIPASRRTPSFSSTANSIFPITPLETSPTSTAPILSDPDDFVIYSQDEADHIAYAIHEAFDVELGSDVVLAAANIHKLAKSVGAARRLLKPIGAKVG